MPRVFAGFEQKRVGPKEVVQVRRDTRFYLADQDGVTPDFGRCIGAFYLINPGRADPMCEPQLTKGGLLRWEWGPLHYGNEVLLPHITRVLDGALERVASASPRVCRGLCKDGYIQLLNLSYVRSVTESTRSIEQWRALIRDGVVGEDVPRHPEAMKFVVFGWGTFYKPTLDGRRVSEAIASYLPYGVRLLFPTMGSIARGRYVRKPRVRRTDAESLRTQIATRNNYACGAQSDRQAFCRRYQAVMGRELANILLHN
jgi:hypothetical protein